MGNRNDCMNFYYIFIQMFNKSHFMKKRLLCIPLWGVLSLFILSSCRTEDNIIQQEKDLRFATFVPKAGEKVDYANGFAFLIKRYDEINNTNFSGYNNSILKGNSSQIPLSGEYINFDLHSQLLEQEDGEKWMMYAKISKDKIIDIMVATLKDKETKVGLFSLQKVDKEYYNEVLPAFNAVWLRIQSKNLHLVAGTKNNLNLIAAKDDDNGSCPPGERCKDIPGVVVKGGGKKNKTKDESDYNWQNPCPLLMNCNDGSGGSSGGGGGVGGSSQTIANIDYEQLKDYPCAYEVATQLPNLGNDLANLLKDIFGNNSKINIAFSAGELQSGRENIILEGNTNYTYNDVTHIFNATTTLNKNVLQTATQEYILRIMYHEVIHAYLGYEFNTLGQTKFEEKYPTVESYTISNSRKFTFKDDYQHPRYAPFIDKMTDAIMSYSQKVGNTNFTRERAKALAMSGLFEDLNNNIGISQIINDESTSNSYSKGKKCN